MSEMLSTTNAPQFSRQVITPGLDKMMLDGWPTPWPPKFRGPKANQEQVEASSPAPPDLHAATLTEHAFVNMLAIAWSSHRGLCLSPDDFWLMIVQGVARHLSRAPEELRERIVPFQGKKTLVVRRDYFTRGALNDWPGVFTELVQLVNENTNPGVADLFRGDFSCSSALQQIASQLTLCDATKAFFDFQVLTMCGFPEITLQGTLEDWQSLAGRASALIARCCTPECAAYWLPALESVLVRFVDLYQGRVDQEFWNDMIKSGGQKFSGGRSWITGWINAFFPEINYVPNRFCQVYQRAAAGKTTDGTDMHQFPSSWTKVPVTWDYLGEEFKMFFRAGCSGYTENLETGVLTPAMGWVITHNSGGMTGSKDEAGNLAVSELMFYTADMAITESAVDKPQIIDTPPRGLQGKEYLPPGLEIGSMFR